MVLQFHLIMYNSKEEKVGNIILEFHPLVVTEVGESLNPNKHRAIVKQKVISKYPAARGGSSLQDALYESDDFGGTGSEFENTRVGFLDIPIGATKEEVQAKLDQLEAPKLVRIMSLFPILTDEQKRTMEIGLNTKTLEEYMESQAIRNPETQEKVQWEGYEQYRVIVFHKDWVEDIDLRPADKATISVDATAPAVSSTSPQMAS